MLRYRLALGPVLIAAIVFGSWLDQWIDARSAAEWFVSLTGRATWPPGVIVLLTVSGLGVLGALELKEIFSHARILVSRRVVVTLVLLGLAATAFVPESISGVTGAAIINSVVTFVLIGSLVFHSRKQQFEGAIAAAGGALVSLVFLGVMFGFLVLIRREHSAWVLLWVLVTTKSCDIGAYFVGRAFGSHKLIPWLSPGKTWEGLFGGMAFAGVIGAIGVWILESVLHTPGPGIWAGVGAGVLFAGIGQVGDLVMSLLKRDAGVKDAGSSLPGFGGVLDVLDSVLLVAPVAFWLLRFVINDARGG